MKKRNAVLLMSQLVLLSSSVVFADYVVFSQYDGINKWENVYVSVDNASDWVKPGVGYQPTQYGHDSVAQSTTGTAWVSPSIVRRYGEKWSKTQKYYENRAYAIDTFTKASESSTFFDRRNTKFFSGEGALTMNLDFVLTSAGESLGVPELGYEETITEEVSSVQKTEVEASYESTLPAKAIVVVKTGEDLSKVVEDFFKEKS